MREITAQTIKQAISKLCVDANIYVNDDILKAFNEGLVRETDELCKDILNMLTENAKIAKDEQIPICQDTGMAVVFMDVGQDVHIVGGLLTDAINEGVRDGYERGFLRKSIVKDPIDRINTKDNTPAIIHYNIVAGDKINITVAPKGFGSENMSALKMLKPSDGIEGVKRFVIDTVKTAGPNPCPPTVVGVGVGGTMEKAAIMAKQALSRPINDKNDNPFWAGIEDELLTKINGLNIGPAGFGGVTTALAVRINTFATHIAGLPVAVNIGCHVTRHSEVTL